ncbi:unnamed protein product, partial [Brassica oleracea]
MSRGDYVALKAQQTQALGYVKVCIRRTIFFRRILGDVDDQYCLHCSSTCSFIIKNTQIFKKPCCDPNYVPLVSRLIMESPGQKVLYEIRHHASFPYVPRYSPLPQ